MAHGHVAEHLGGDTWRNKNVPRGHGGRHHVFEPRCDTWPNREHDTWTSKKMTHVRIRMRHVKHESETWASRNTTRGRLVAPEFRHVAFP